MDLKDPERIWMSKTEALAYVQRVYHRFPLWMARGVKIRLPRRGQFSRAADRPGRDRPIHLPTGRP